jgi:hypothetical protein
MSRTVIVSAQSPILHHRSTRCLHTYENGDCLVQTAAPQLETGESDETPVLHGLALPQVESNQGATRMSTEADATEPIQAYLELIGPVDPRWLVTLTDLGLELLQYQPQNSYLCQGPAIAFEQARQQTFVQQLVFRDQVIKAPLPLGEAADTLVLVVVQGSLEEAPTLVTALNGLPGVQVEPHQEIDQVNFYLRLRARVSGEGQTALLSDPRVLAVEPYSPPQVEDEVAGLIIAGQYDLLGRPQGSYLQWLEDHGVNGDGVTIGIVDAGVDGGHPAFGDRATDLSYGKKSWHGTFVAGHAAGCYLEERDGNQFIYGLGVAPKAQILIQDNQRGAMALCQETVTAPPPIAPGTIQNNSWGMGTANPMTYSSLEATYDQLVRNANPQGAVAQPLTLCFSAGNAGAAGLTRPKAAKNLIVTGNSETFRPEVGKDQSDNIHEVYTGPRGSSHGNCADGRIVPHVMAPGEWTASANFGVSPGDREYISARLTWGGGTSGASPKTAGACALLTQWWRRFHQGATPSPAMLKALVVNGAEPMQSGGAIPNPIQGWGRLNLENIFNPALERIYVDQQYWLRQRGDSQRWSLRVANPRYPVKLTLCWTDPPGPLGSGTEQAPAVVNKLALRLQVGERLYRANQFSNGWSVADGSPHREGWDNLQNIFLPAGAVNGPLEVVVTALEVTMNGLTGQVMPPQQDFALVLSNVTVIPTPTQAVVKVAVDSPPPVPPPPAPVDNFWQPTVAGRDQQEFDQHWWQGATGRVTAPASTPPSSPPSPRSTAADLWWLQGQPWGRANEADRDMVNLTPWLSRAAATAQGTVVLADGPLLEAGEPGEAPSLGQRLGTLVAQTPSTPEGQGQTVVVVRPHSRFSSAHLAALRHLATQGPLYLVSDCAPVLAFLAQRIGATGLQLRLAQTADQLGALVHDTVLEASGGVRVETHQRPIPSTASATAGASPGIDHDFQLVTTDQQVTLQLPQADSQHPSPVLIRPDGTQLTLSPLPVDQGMAQISLIAAEQPSWAGTWTLRSPYTAPIAVWTWGTAPWQLQAQRADPDSGSTSPESRYLLTLTAPDMNLHRLQAQPLDIQPTGQTLEHPRAIEATLSLPRASAADTCSQPTSAPVLSTLVTLPPTPGAAALDLPLRVEGCDAAGHPFCRWLRYSLIQREPYSRWRRRCRQEQGVVFTPARITELHYRDRTVVALTLTHEGYSRQVQVTSSVLQDQLQQRPSQHWRDRPVVVGVLQDELWGIYCPLSLVPATRLLPFTPQEVNTPWLPV